jgi:hypothetical protein
MSSSGAIAPDPRPGIPGPDFSIPSNQDPDDGDESNPPETDDRESDDLQMQLRNPSDALQILSQVKESPQAFGADQRQWPHLDTWSLHSGTSKGRSTEAMAASTNLGIPSTTTGEEPTTPTNALDDYELIRRGTLHPAVVHELLHMYVQISEQQLRLQHS